MTMTAGGVLASATAGSRAALAQSFHDFHGMGGMGIAYWISAILGVLFIVGVVALIVAVAWRLFRGGREDGRRPATADVGPLDILERRYARGEIDREEYLQKRDDLTRG